MASSTNNDEELLNDELQEAVRELTRRFGVYAKWSLKRIAKETGETHDAMKDMISRATPKKAPPKRFAAVLIELCKREKYSPPIYLARALGILWEPLSPRHEPIQTEAAISEESHMGSEASAPLKPADLKDTFMAALGLTQTVAETSKQIFNGDYLLFTLNSDENVVTTKYYLLDKLGQDGAPSLTTSRNYPAGEVKSLGTYFCRAGEYSNLYLLASPPKTVDLRLSIFDVVVGEKKQLIIRGVALTVTRQNSILTSRAVLVPAANVDTIFAPVHVQLELWQSPTPQSDFEKLGNDAVEISGYLYGQESDDVLKAKLIELKSGDKKRKQANPPQVEPGLDQD
ncbi:hypothetical protein QWJ07_26465 [Frankia sp. RB7]|nr:hypothetical protein [Frankia sp. RB7]